MHPPIGRWLADGAAAIVVAMTLLTSLVVLVLTAHAALAVDGLLGGRSLFDRGIDPDTTFGDHWLTDLDSTVVDASALAISVSTAVALLLMRRSTAGPLRPALIGWGWLAAGFLALVLPGNLSLYVVPFLLPLVAFRVGWPEASIILLAAAGLVVAVATVRYARRTGSGCARCGRTARWSRRQPSVERAARVAAYVAALAPLPYAGVRVAWAAGIPVGTTQEFLDRIEAANPGHGTVLMELVLAGMAVGGGLLCWGLTRPWGRHWPRWVPLLGRSPVPRWLPVGMGVVCGVGLAGYATMLVPDLVAFAAGEPATFDGTDVPMTWSSHLPALALVVWAPAVVVASVLFGYATRPRCLTCGRG